MNSAWKAARARGVRLGIRKEQKNATERPHSFDASVFASVVIATSYIGPMSSPAAKVANPTNLLALVE